MIKPYKESKKGKKEQVRLMFDSIAPRYDLLNRVLSVGIDRRWRARLVRSVSLQQPGTILDLATGTGDLALALAKALPAARITGADLSLEMLRIARRKVKDKGLRLPMMECDAENLPFPAGSFDAVTCAFGVRNFEHLDKGLSEMWRMLRPDGELYILEFSMPPKNSLHGKLYHFYFSRILPKIGRIVSRDTAAYTYLPQSVDEFPYGQQFVERLEKAGFTEARNYRLTGGIATLYTARKP